ncbi:MAG: polysaccharide deacetylase family protein [Chitinivibrionales bacterium]|nr:polysaccharide deacetylase family protein [Chitinivibrionales bacterium]
MLKILSTSLIVLFYLGGFALDNVPYSFDPPGGLKADNVPLFIVMGYDDCMYPDGMQWVLDTLMNRTNPKGNNNPATFDGQSIKGSFYVNSCYATDSEAVKTWKLALSRGHEIANHTHDHDEKLLENVSQTVWFEEMKTCHDWIEKNLGIPASEIWGFRTPFLAQSNSSFAAEDQIKFVYDCSVTLEPKDYDRIFYWPYTLDKGTAPGSVGNYGNHPGLWEIPVYNAALDPSGYPHMCGMDFSIWPRMTKQEEMFNVLKWTLDMRLASGKNRAPMTVGMHPDLYSPSNDEQLVTSWPVKVNQRKASIIQFVDYALSKPMVRFVSARQLIQWMRKPIGLDAVTQNAQNQPGRIPAVTVRANFNTVTPTLNLFVASAGTYVITVSTLQGRQITSRTLMASTPTTMTLPLVGCSFGNGAYVVSCKSEQVNYSTLVVTRN